MLLSGDAGGSKTRLALFEFENGRLAKTELETYISKDFPDLQTIIALFLGRYRVHIEKACFGVPGPVVDGEAQTTNLPWTLQESEIRQASGISSVTLVNDLVATAAAVPLLGPDDLFPLHQGKKAETAEMKYAVLAPGTGLGQAFLHVESERAVVLPSEGGHADFAPTTALQIELLQYLQPRFGRVSYERVLSGPGLENIYNFLKTSRYATEPPELAQRLKEGDPAAVISGVGLAGQNELCVKALDIFAEILGAQAGNLALNFLATGGVYLGGGIPPKLCKKLKDGTAVAAYLNKGRLSNLVADTSLFVIQDEQAALLGAAAIAARR